MVSRIVICLTVLFARCTHRPCSIAQTRVYAFFPPGAQAGTTTDVTVTSGADLEELSKLLFNHPGITAVQKMQDQAGKSVPVANTFTVSVAADVPAGLTKFGASGCTASVTRASSRG